MVQNRFQSFGCQWRHVIGSFFGVFVVLAILSSCSGCHRKSTPEIVYVGHVASFQGPDKTNGEHARQGIQLALEEAEGADGTINDRRMEVIHVDCKGDPKAVEPATVRLVVINRVVGLLAGSDGEQASVMTGIAHNYEIPLVTSGILAGEKPDDYVFCTGLSPDAQVRALAEFAIQKKSPPVMKLAILTDRASSRSLADKFSQAVQKAKGTIVGEWNYKEYRKASEASESDWHFKSSEDLKEIMEQIRKQKPEGIFMVGAIPDLPRLRKSGLDEALPIFWGGGEETTQAPQSDSSHQPIFFVSPFVPSDDDRQKEFARLYESRFQEVPDAAAALAYDNTRILIEGIKRAASFKGPAIKQAIEDLKDFQTLTGLISFDKQNHWPNRPAFVIQIQGGRSKVVYKAPAGKT